VRKSKIADNMNATDPTGNFFYQAHQRKTSNYSQHSYGEKMRQELKL